MTGLTQTRLEDFDPETADFGDSIEAPEAQSVTETTAEAPAPAEVKEEAPVEAAVADAEAVPEAAAESVEPDSAAEDKHVSGMIPKHRFDFIQSKRKAAEERARELEARIYELESATRQPEAATQPDARMDDLEAKLGELDQKIEDARLDGDTKAVATMLSEQRRLEREYLTASQTPEAREVVNPEQVYAQVQERQQFDRLINALESSFPQLKEGEAAFDQDLVDEVLDAHAAFSARGYGITEAMAKAANYVLLANGLIAPNGTEVKAEAPKAVSKRTTDVDRNLEAAAAQPPSIDKAGMDTNKAGVQKTVDIARMSMDDFDKLSEDALAKIRGDFDV